MRTKKVLNILMAFVIVFMTILPPGAAFAAPHEVTTLGDTPAGWPTIFTPYTHSNGTPIFDPGHDINPIDVDITSGVDRGVGNLPSMYVASDGTNFFVRLRVKGDPYDRKGGFLSSVWLVKLGVGGQHRATIGLNGKSPHYDYVYVANANGTNVQPIYVTPTQGGNSVPGTQITPAENGHYFLDFQVPINRITGIAPEITASTPVQVFFGTSKAANLSVINKEWMNTSSANGSTESFSGLLELQPNRQPLTISIDGGASKIYDATNKTVTGKTTLQSGNATLTINGGTAITVPVTNKNWSYELPASITGTNGIYQLVATIAEDGKTASARQEIMINHNSDTLTIDGGPVAETSSATPTLSGTYAGSNSNNVRIKIYIDNGPDITPNTGASRDTTNLTWTQSNVALSAPVNGKAYQVKVEWTGTGSNATIFATTTQQLIYRQGVTITPIKVGITTISAGATPSFAGTSSGASEIELRVGDKTVAFATPNPSTGAWEVPALDRPLSPGLHSITAIARNNTTNTAVSTKAHTVNATATVITIDNGSTTTEATAPTITISDDKPTIRGNTNAPNGSNISVKIGNRNAITTTAQNGRWSVDVPLNDPLTEGTYTVTATTINSATAVQKLALDTTTSVAISAPANQAIITQTQPVISGTAEAGATVDVRVLKAGEIVVVRNLTATNGTWSITDTPELTQGLYTVVATASDLYGNEATATSTFTLNVPKSIESVNDVRVSVPYGSNIDFARTQLGNEVPVNLVDGGTTNVPITWSLTSIPTYNGNVAGDYVFTGTFGTFPTGVINDGGVNPPKGIVTVQPQQTISIDSVNPIVEKVPYGTSLEAARSTLGDEVTVILVGGNTRTVKVNWSVDSTTPYNGFDPQSYSFTGTLVDLPSDINNNNILSALGTVEVETANITEILSIRKNYAVGTELETARNSLGDKINVTLSSGHITEINVTWSDNSIPEFNSNEEGEYMFSGTLQLPNGITNTLNLNAEGIITLESVPSVPIDSTDSVSFTVPYHTSLETVKNQLPNEIFVYYGDKSTPVSVSWSENSAPSYNGVEAGVYVFTGILSNLPVGVNNNKNIQATGTVTVLGITATPTVTNKIKVGDSEITGNSESNATIIIYLDDVVIGTAVANESGNWKITLNDEIELKENDELRITATVAPKLESLPLRVIVGNPVIIGQILDNNGKAIVGAKVWVEGGNGYIFTDEEGNYQITVPAHGEYTVNVEVKTIVGDKEINSIFSQNAVVTETGQTEFKAEKNVSGQVLVLTQAGYKHLNQVGVDLDIKVLDDKQVAVEVGENGNYYLKGFLPEETYRIIFNVSVNGNRLAGKLSTIKVGKDGQMIINFELIDPFGLITDSVTGELIPGVEVKLYWANTERNKNIGRDPDTLVNLPELLNFPPNQNKNPQFSTDWLENTAEIGNYAWMVYAHGDYYIKAEKQGYEPFDSRDTEVNEEIGDSKIENGIITVENTMVRYDFTMDATDEYQVLQTIRGLTFDFAAETDTWESVTSKVFLLRTDKYETDVRWISSHPEVVSILEEDLRSQRIGAETYRQQKDQSVLITAEVSKGGIKRYRTFLLVIKASGIVKDTNEEVTRNVKIGDGDLAVIRIDVKKDGGVIGTIDKIIVKDNPPTVTADGLATIALPENPSDKATEFAVEIDRSILHSLAANNNFTTLKVENTYGEIVLSKDEINRMAGNNLDLFIRFVPITETVAKQEIKTSVRTEEAVITEAAGKQVNVLGTPLKIDTNIQGFETEVTIPLDEIQGDIQNPENLRVFIEHTDGQKVVANSWIVYENGQPVGIKFTIFKFSTFTIFEIINPAAPPPQWVGPTPGNQNPGSPTDSNQPVENPNPSEPPVNNPGETPTEENPTVPIPPANQLPSDVSPTTSPPAKQPGLEQPAITEQTKQQPNQNKGTASLPSTASPLYNLMVIGLLILTLGFALLFRKRSQN